MSVATLAEVPCWRWLEKSGWKSWREEGLDIKRGVARGEGWESLSAKPAGGGRGGRGGVEEEKLDFVGIEEQN